MTTPLYLGSKIVISEIGDLNLGGATLYADHSADPNHTILTTQDVSNIVTTAVQASQDAMSNQFSSLITTINTLQEECQMAVEKANLAEYNINGVIGSQNPNLAIALNKLTQYFFKQDLATFAGQPTLSQPSMNTPNNLPSND